MAGHIYLVTNEINGKQYVGQSVIERNKVGHGKLITKAYNKHGKENFTYERICSDINNRATLNFIERFWIKVMDCRKPTGYNIEEGGSTKGEVSQETRAKLSAARKKQIFSMETRQKLSDAAKRQWARQKGVA